MTKGVRRRGVRSRPKTDMNALGIQIISCNIQRVTDENSLINSLGQDNMCKIQKDAAIAKAEAERDIAIAQAQAARRPMMPGGSGHDIAQKQNDLAIKQSELKVQEDTKAGRGRRRLPSSSRSSSAPLRRLPSMPRLPRRSGKPS